MEEDEDGNSTPFWLQNTTNNIRLRRIVSSLFFSSGLVVFLLLVIALLFLVFVVPSTLSFSTRIFRPNSVKKSWNSLNVVLVLAALLFGFLSRIIKNNNDHDEFQAASPNKQAHKSKPTNSAQWYNSTTIDEQKLQTRSSNSDQLYNEYQDYYNTNKLDRRNSILRRNTSSYPDLRELSSNRWNGQRSFVKDDFHVGQASDPGKVHRRHRSVEEVDLRALSQIKTVFVDTLSRHSEEATHLSPYLSPSRAKPAAPAEYAEKHKTESVARRKERSNTKLGMDLEPIASHKPPPAPPSAPNSVQPELQKEPERAKEILGRNKVISRRKLNKDVRSTNPNTIPLQQSPPPPPPPPEQNISKSDRKRGGVKGTATKDFLNSIYQMKKKKTRLKSVENLDSLLHQAQDPLTFQLPPPMPPPPPPPPPSVFQNMFLSKKQKRKRTISVSVTPHPPSAPQPPPPCTTASEPKPKSETSPLLTHKPEREIKIKSFEKFEENSNSGGESPLNRIPPPPPPPPPVFFRNTAWKFVVEGDYVRIDSSTSSRSESSDLDDVDSDATPSAAKGSDVTPMQPSSLFCPSPDVNTKAESFITSFRAKLKLEKVNSMNKRELGLSGLGPRPGRRKN